MNERELYVPFNALLIITGQQPPKGWNEGWCSFQTTASGMRTHTSQWYDVSWTTTLPTQDKLR